MDGGGDDTLLYDFVHYQGKSKDAKNTKGAAKPKQKNHKAVIDATSVIYFRTRYYSDINGEVFFFGFRPLPAKLVDDIKEMSDPEHKCWYMPSSTTIDYVAELPAFEACPKYVHGKKLPNITN